MGKAKLQPWWDSQSTKYPYQCQTTMVLRSERIPNTYDPFIMIVLSPGIRTWGFTTEANLRAFELRYERYLTQCQNTNPPQAKSPNPTPSSNSST